MKIKTSELQNDYLDWAVAKAEGWEPFVDADGVYFYDFIEEKNWRPSSDWSQGGPIIERERLCIAWLSKQDLGMEPEYYCVAHADGVYTRYGSTPLIAAMRCYVASKLGDEVKIPVELESVE